MANYLSDEWFDEVGATDGAPAAGSTGVLVLQHLVTGGPQGPVWYHVRVGETPTVVRGQAVGPDVTFAKDYATAAAIFKGELSAPAALLAGKIRVRGDLGRLVAHQGDLTLDDPLPRGGAVRHHVLMAS